ncbi:MAG: Fic family protein [Christensenellaceae bacterium]|jgi:Fic family protein|nr:Fic family protein [Christensenellaceae bacterium]
MSNFLYKPNYTITNEILTLVAQIAARVDVLAIQSGMEQNPKLRRINRIRSIHSSLAIENNSLSLDQVTAIIDGKRVLAPPQDICEVENAFQAYNKLLKFNPYNIMDLLTAHQILMKDLVKEPGSFRRGNVGVFRGKEVVHIAPPADNVSGLMADLILWTKDAAIHPLVKSCVFHYEFEFIHPFADGNGRMGRMWQTLLLYQWKEIFAWLPVESIVRERQEEYYSALRRSNDAMDSTEFIEFMLQAIWDTLEKYADTDQDSDQATDQVKRLLNVLGSKTLSATELMELLELKHRPTFRKNYLHPALEQGLIEMALPDTPNSRNQRYRKSTRNPDKR